MTKTHLVPTGTLGEPPAKPSLSDFLSSLAGGPPKAKARKRKPSVRKQDRDQAHLSTPAPNLPVQTADKPTAIVLYMTSTTCACGNVMDAPTFGRNSTFVRLTPHRIAMGFKILRNPYPIPHACHSHTLLHDPSAAPKDIPWLTTYTYESCATCPKCHNAFTSQLLLNLPIPDGTITPIERATRAFYTSLLAVPKEEPTFVGSGAAGGEVAATFKHEVDLEMKQRSCLFDAFCELTITLPKTERVSSED